MELRRFANLFRRHLLLALVTVVAGAAIGYATTSKTARYEAAATVYVGSRQLNNDPVQFYGAAGFSVVVQTFAEMLPSPVIAQAAIEATHVPRSAGLAAAETKASVVPNTNLIQVTVTDTDPVVAQALANGMVNAFVAKVQHYDPSAPTSAGSLPIEPAYVFQPAALPGVPLSTGATRHALLGGILGLVVAVLAILTLDYLDVTVRGAEDLERRLDLPVLAVLPLCHDLEGRAETPPLLLRPPLARSEHG